MLSWKRDDKRFFVYENCTVEKKGVLPTVAQEIRYGRVRVFERAGVEKGG